MKVGKIVATSVLWILVIVLGIFLYSIINDPIVYKENYSRNFDATTKRMKDIRIAQGFYLEVNKEYANNFDDLINSIKTDDLQIIKIIGDVDDSTTVTIFDTLYIPLRDTVRLAGTPNLDSLKYIPYSEGEMFDLNADVIKVQLAQVPVYEVKATKNKYLKGLNEDFVRNEDDLILGSLVSPSEAASWE